MELRLKYFLSLLLLFLLTDAFGGSVNYDIVYVRQPRYGVAYGNQEVLVNAGSVQSLIHLFLSIALKR